MKQIFKGSVAIVTGASRGLGRATGASLAAAGAAVVLVARSADALFRLAEELHATGGRVRPLAGDIGDPDFVRQIVSNAVAEFGRIDFVVNIAGAVDGIGKAAWDAADDEVFALLRTNLLGPLLLAREVLPAMLRQGAGRILTLTSPAAQTVIPGAAIYGSSKAGLNQFVRTLASELYGTGVTANAFNPGPVSTPTLERVTAALQPVTRTRWRGAARSPEEAAGMILWLLSPATAQLTGQIVHWRDPAIRSQVAAFTAALARE